MLLTGSRKTDCQMSFMITPKRLSNVIWHWSKICRSSNSENVPGQNKNKNKTKTKKKNKNKKKKKKRKEKKKKKKEKKKCRLLVNHLEYFDTLLHTY